MREHAYLVLAALCVVTVNGAFGQTPPSAKKKPAVRIEISVPAKGDVRTVESRGIPITLELVNESEAEVVFWPYVSLEITGADGKPVKPSRALGRFGLRKHACLLRCMGYETVPARTTRRHESTSKLFTLDPALITGYRRLSPGVYTLVFRYSASRKDIRATCRSECADHAKGSSPWNRVHELQKRIERKIVVQ